MVSSKYQLKYSLKSFWKLLFGQSDMSSVHHCSLNLKLRYTLQNSKKNVTPLPFLPQSMVCEKCGYGGSKAQGKL